MWRAVAGSTAASAQRESREPLWRLGRGIADRVNGVPSATKFQRVYDAPTMDPPTLLRTLSDLKLERSSDVFLMEALARRCAASMEEFFPPQLETAIESFAELRFSDQQLLQAFVGRLDDLVADASPRRLVRLLRDGAALRLRSDAWLERLLPQMRRQLPNLHLGLPTMLASLRALRFHGPELADLLLAQGLLAERAEQTQTQTAQAQSQSQRFFIQLFERWSRLSSPVKLHSKAAEMAEQRAVDLVNPHTVQSEDIREGLSLLAGLVRRGRQREAATLEQLLEERLRERGQGQGQGQGQGMGHGCDDALVALLWMQGLSLRSAKLWRACGDAVEVSLSGDRLLSTRNREPLCGAVQALASLSPAWDRAGESGTSEGALLAGLLIEMTQQKQLARYSASQTLSLLHAACLHHEEGGGDNPPIPWPQLVRQTFRLARQLTLPERRLLSTVVEYLKGEKAEVMEKLQAMPPLPLASLPPLTQGYPGPEEPWLQVETGIEALLQQPSQSSQDSTRKHCAVKFLGFEDTLTSTEPGIEVEDEKDLCLAPSCQLSVRALAHAGWELELRP